MNEIRTMVNQMNGQAKEQIECYLRCYLEKTGCPIEALVLCQNIEYRENGVYIKSWVQQKDIP
uniref:Uncharacterized protein n=1 Tax=viral metagenome TaxID=1070528 RepID=A0A6M3LBN0_9ZZZZ